MSKLPFFYQVLMDIFSNYIPKAVDDKDPSWMNKY